MKPSDFTLAMRCGVTALFGIVAASAAQAQVAARDSAGSPLRAPTAAEAQALHPAGAKKSAPVGLLTGRPNPQPIVHADGTVEQELDTSTLMYSVARRNADGSLSFHCVEGASAAQQVLDGKIVSTHKGHGYELK